MAIEKKPDIRELVGVAVNTSALVTTREESALDRVGALGAAALEVSLGADIEKLPIAAMVCDVYRRSADMRDVMLDPGTPDQRDQIVAELAPLMWHIRYGAQFGLVRRAVKLYATWLHGRRLFADMESGLLERFAGRALHEYLSDLCVVCGGSGRLEINRTGQLVRGLGVGQRNARFAICSNQRGRGGCDGTGKARPSPIERVRWLGIERAAYDEGGWGQRFNAADSMLKSLIMKRMERPLTGQLERRKKRI